jgi:hypothetical protein
MVYKQNKEYNSPYLIALISEKNIQNANPSNNDKILISPMTGSEPKYDPAKWNNNYNIKDTHNCYAYALNKIVSNRKGKPQPGYYSKFPSLNNNDYKCNVFLKRLKKDIPSLYVTKFNGKCKKGFYKAFIAIDPKQNDHDYHFYRQDSNGKWSHKPGRTEVVNLDADNKEILNPALANRDYKHYNYSVPCFFFCLNSKLSKSVSIN